MAADEVDGYDSDELTQSRIVTDQGRSVPSVQASIKLTPSDGGTVDSHGDMRDNCDWKVP